MMCSNCGEELRPGARFCNKCGTPAPAEQSEQGTTTAESAPEGGDETSSGKLRRPPRPLRARDGEDVLVDEEDAARDESPAPTEIADVDTAQLSATSTASPLETKPVAVAVMDGESEESEKEETTAPLSPEELEDAPTMEYDTVGTSGSGVSAASSSSPSNSSPSNSSPANSLPSASVPNMEAPVAGASTPADGLPWPLPASMIVGGRYRVEELLRAAGEERNAENIYHVSDLQAYEECWACHERHGIEAASEQYCPACGADMLARVFLMYERLLVPGTGGEPGEDDIYESPTLRDMPVEGEQRIFEQGARLYRVVAQAIEEVLFPKGPRVVGASASDAGLTRPADHNEDSLGLVILSNTHNSRTEPFALAAVADGLGGHASGMDASRTVIQVMMERILREVLTTRWEGSDEEQALDLEALLRAGAFAANKALCDINKATEIDSGSTLVSALIFGDTACIANMGDSRAYVLDHGQLRRISVDHSLVEQFVGAGMITDEERYSHPQRNQVFRSLGSEENLEPDIFTQKLRPGMRFMLCSDGLWEMVRDDEIGHILREMPTVQQACDALIKAANAHGGEDNIAVVVLEVDA